MCGLLLFLFRNLSIRALLWWAAGFFLLDFALFFGLWSGLVAAASGAAPDMRDALTQIHGEMGADSPTHAQQVALQLGRYAWLLAYRTTEELEEPVQGVVSRLLVTMGRMLARLAVIRAPMLKTE